MGETQNILHHHPLWFVMIVYNKSSILSIVIAKIDKTYFWKRFHNWTILTTIPSIWVECQNAHLLREAKVSSTWHIVQKIDFQCTRNKVIELKKGWKKAEKEAWKILAPFLDLDGGGESHDELSRGIE